MKIDKKIGGGVRNFSVKSHSLKKLWLALILTFFSAALVFCAFLIPFNTYKTVLADTNTVTYTAPIPKAYTYTQSGDPSGSDTIKYVNINGTAGGLTSHPNYPTGLNVNKTTTSSVTSNYWRTTYFGVKASIVVPAYTEYKIEFTVNFEAEKVSTSGESTNRAGIGILYYGNDHDDASAGDKIDLCQFAGSNYSKISFTDGGQYFLNYIENNANHSDFGNPSKDVTTKTLTYTNTTNASKTYNAYFGHLSWMDSTETGHSPVWSTAYYTSATFTESITPTKLSVTRPTADTAVYRYTGQSQTYTINGWDATKMRLATDSDALSQTEVGTYTVKVVPITYPWDDEGSGFNSDPIEFTFTIIKGTPITKPKYTLPNPNYVSNGLPTMTNDGTPGTYSWGEQQAQAGENSYQWLFTPTDTTHYETATGSITFTFVEPTISSIAVTAYNPPAAGVYTSATITDLKGYLTVTATYADGTTAALTNYNLTIGGGKLVAGSNTLTITTTDGGKFCKYTLNGVTAVEIDDILTADLTDYNFTYPVTEADVKAKLTNVMVSYNNGTTGTLAGYDDVTISGTLNVGNNVPLSIGISGTAINYTDTKINIAKGTYDVSGITLAGNSAPYDGQPHALSISGTLPDGVTAVYNYACAANGYNSATAPTDAGEYTVTVSFTHSNSNYNDITDTKSATLTITKTDYPDSDGITVADVEITYGESYSVTAQRLPEGVTASYLYENADGYSSSTAPTDAGEYTVTVSFTHSNSNYNEIQSKTATLKIAKADYPDADKITFEDETFTYGQEYSIAAKNVPEGVTVTYEGNGQTELGEHTVTAKFSHSNTNYNDIADKSAKIIITDKKVYDKSGLGISVNGGSELHAEYTGEAIAVTPTGKVKDADGNEVELSCTVTIKLGDEEVSEIREAGEYTITVKYTGADAEYEPEFEKKYTVTVTGEYDLSGITFDSITLEYDAAEHGIEITGELPEGVSVTYEGNGQTAVGEYTITARFSHSNAYYGDIEDRTATLIITKRKITVVIDPLSSEAGAELAQITATVTEGSVIAGDNPYVLICSPDKDKVGEYPVSWEYAEGYEDKYEITCEGGVYIVSKKSDDGNGNEIDMPVDISAEFKVIQSKTDNEYNLKGLTHGYYAELWHRNEDGTLGDEYEETMNCILTMKVPDEIVKAICGEGEQDKDKIAEKLRVYYVDKDGDAVLIKNYTLARRDDESWIVKFNYNDKFKAEVVFNAAGVEVEPEAPESGNLPIWVFVVIGAAVLLFIILIIALVSRRRRYAYDDDYDDEYYDEDDDDDYDDYDDYDD